jgi:hypothetical protein
MRTVTFRTGKDGARAPMLCETDAGGVFMITGFFSVFAALTALLVLATCGLALLPALLVVGAIVLAFSLAAGVIGLILRVFGALLLAVLALPLALGAFGLMLAIVVAMLHAMLPLIVIGVVVWLMVRHRRPAPASLPHAP